MPTKDNLARVEAATLCLVNLRRAAHGLASLGSDPRLRRAAKQHSQDVVARDYYAHTSPSGQTFLSRLMSVGYLTPGAAYSAGENINGGFETAATPAAVVATWMNSPVHRANILGSDYMDSGVGVVPAVPARFGSSWPGATYTEEFGVSLG